MTWIAGAITPVGKAVLIGDSRVTFPNGYEADLVRKVFWVAPDIAVGFSGSVRIGLELIALLRSRLVLNKPGTWLPEAIARRWSSEIATLFVRYPKEERDLGCSFLISAVSPRNNGPFPRTVMVTLKSPSFKLEVLANYGCTQIGSGSAYAPYREWLEGYFNTPVFMANFASWGTTVGIVLADSLREKVRALPTKGVGPHLHVVSCCRGQHSEGAVTRDYFDDSEREPVPQVADTYAAFLHLAAQINVESAAAVG